MIYANDYVRSTDSETLNAAIVAREADGIVVISPRVSDVDPERDFWLLDEAILLPENTTVILNNCKIKLSDTCRDNFFRTANCGLGIADPAPIENIHLRGEGLCILEGADRPRSTGDGGKILSNPILYGDGHDKTFGTDAGKESESQFDACHHYCRCTHDFFPTDGTICRSTRICANATDLFFGAGCGTCYI